MLDWDLEDDFWDVLSLSLRGRVAFDDSLEYFNGAKVGRRVELERDGEEDEYICHYRQC